MRNHLYYIYILTDRHNKVLYTGVTNNLQRRVFEHKTRVYKGFSSQNNCNKLVYFEKFQWINDAIAREKQIKGGSRQKKIDLINKLNPAWDDLVALLRCSSYH